MPVLSRSEALELSAVAALTPAALKEKAPAVLDRLAAQLAAPLRAAVLTRVRDADAETRAWVDAVDLTPAVLPGGADARRVVLDDLAARGAPASVLRHVEERLAPFPHAALDAETPVRDDPRLRELFHVADLHALAASAGLAEATVERALAGTDTMGGITDAHLAARVKAGALAEADARRLGRLLGLYQLTDGDAALVKALDTDGLDPRALARWDEDDWRAALEKASATDGSAEGRAATLARRFAALHPGDALLARLAPREGESSLATLDAEGRTRVARAYPGLGIDALLEKGDADAAAKRIGLLGVVRDANPSLDPLRMDWSADSEDRARLDLSAVPEADRPAVTSALKAHRRAFALAGSVEGARALLLGGYARAADVVRAGPDALARDTGLDLDAARAVHARAAATVGAVTAAVGTVLDAGGGGFDVLAVNNTTAEVRDFLRRLDGWTEMFGSQASCRCESCQSMLGPAAYFVDLMRFVERHVTSTHFTGLRAGHPLSLPMRRPDLWTLELSCENIEQKVPTLDIANEVMESWLARRLGYTGDLRDRAAVEAAVYRQALAATVGSFRQPFLLPLARVEAYLAHFALSRADVARTVGASAQTQAAARLGIAGPGWALVTQADASQVALERVFGAFTVGPDGFVPPLDVLPLLERTGLTREELGAALETRFVRAGSPGALAIVAEKTSADSVQNDIERVRFLTRDAMDRLHRFVRLLRRLPWTAGELDLALTHAAPSVPGGRLDAAAAQALARLLHAQERLSATVEEAAGLAGDLPVHPAGDGASLFDRLFNHPALVASGGTLPRPDERWIHPAFRAPGAAPPADPVLQRLLAGLRVDAEALVRLVTRLHAALGFDPADPVEAGRGFALSLRSLSLLWRHARLAERLKLPVDELFQLLSFALPSGAVADADGLEAALAFHAWWKESGHSLDDLGVATRGEVRRPGEYPDSAAVAREIADEVRAARALHFADTVFAFAGLTEAQSRAVVAANADRFEPAEAGGSLRLAPGIDPGAPLAVPDGIAADGATLAAALRAFHPSAVLPPRLAARLALPAEKLAALLPLAGAELNDAAYALALREDGDPAPLAELVARLVPLGILFRDPAIDAQAIAWIDAHRALFGVAAFGAVDVAAARRISIYRTLSKPRTDPRFGGTEAPRPEDLRAVLQAFEAQDGFGGADVGELARVLGLQPQLVPALLAAVALPSSAPEALEKLAACAALVRALGVDPAALHAIVAEDYDGLDRAAGALLAAFRARHADEAAWQQALEPFEDRVRAARRDALADYLVHSVHPEFPTRRDLYHHFLVDVELEPGARTSRVVSAIGSVQLYVHRVMLNLEQNEHAPFTNPSVHVPPDAIPAAEWAWRRAYRVWEANRKVFLYPENYLDPALRDDRTPLFQALEAELLQQEVNDQHVLDAYGTYLAGFDELAGLEIGGAYHDVNFSTDSDVLHLFGVTASDPAAWYYRTAENVLHSEIVAGRGLRWTPWRRVELPIAVRRVAPVLHRGRMYLFWAAHSTRPVTQVTAGEAVFRGYQHVMSLRFSTLRLDGTWTPPQEVSLDMRTYPFIKGAGVISDVLNSGGYPRLDPARTHSEPLDGYTIAGPNYEEVYPQGDDPYFGGEMSLVGRNYQVWAALDPHTRRLSRQTATNSRGNLHPGVPLFCARPTTDADPNLMLYYGLPTQWYVNENAFANLVIDKARIVEMDRDDTVTLVDDGLYTGAVMYLNTPAARLMAVSGNVEDAIVGTAGETFLLQGSARPGADYVWRRLGTRLGRELPRKLFVDGVDGLLGMQYQLSLKEGGPPVSPYSVPVSTYRSPVNALDYAGPFGTYYREVFFHVPFLLATHLNGQGRYAEAQRWFHYLFDPTAHAPLSSYDTPAQREQKIRDRVWRYREFRGLSPARLRDLLTDPVALEQYRTDPFNPHAIARLRISAYQKAVVMRYVDNLLDWGDSLFAQFTPESVNEATLLYAMAADILGERPARLGSCGTGEGEPRTYETIRPHLSDGSEFLIEMETAALSATGSASAGTVAATGDPADPPPRAEGGYEYVVDAALAGSIVRGVERGLRLRAAGGSEDGGAGDAAGGSSLSSSATVSLAAGGAGDGVATVASVQVGKIVGDPAASTPTGTTASGEAAAAPAAGVFRGTRWKETRVGGWGGADGGVGFADHGGTDAARMGSLAEFGMSVAEQVCPVFCVPPNAELHGYWDRVEDRLFKVRHGMDLGGMRREVPLFAPEIDPRLLVRMRAAGLTLEDVLSATGGNLPPYRFAVLIDRARQYAATLQGFGVALLAALEKKDAEELNRLRTVHQQHLLQMSSRVRTWEIEAAQDSIETLERQKAAVEYRRGYYEALVRDDRNDWETAQSVARHVVSGLRGGSAALATLSGALHLLPQLGSPFAMKYGGIETGTSAARFAYAAQTGADMAEAIAASSGLEAGFARRTEGWRHQVDLAEHELRQVDRQLEAARIRKLIAERSLQIHERTIEQAEEVFGLYGERFTGLGLYTWLSATLQRLHREAYNAAYSMARLAEQAYRFERGDEGAPLLEGGYWDAQRGGLLAGERLMLALQALERRFTETNYRSLEIDQSFSLTQIDPAALVRLRETGTCDFEVPELFYDLFYPGHYRRRIRSVRLTLPCITGPYTNVGATLTLLGSAVRTGPGPGAAHLKEVPPRRSVSVATSTAQNDGGVFEMSFRDERYMPFEGAGAVSRWRLSLPRSFRPFDYATLNDAILHVAYTAEEDGALRERVEEANAALEGTLMAELCTRPLVRIFSLRQDFSSAFHRLLHTPAGTPVQIRITDRFLPLFLAGRAVQVTDARLVLRTTGGAGVDGLRIAVDGAEPASPPLPDAALGGLRAAPLPPAFGAALVGEHTLAVVDAGELAPAAPPPGDASALDADRLADVLLYVEYRLASS
jgi:hypothetical protein